MYLTYAYERDVPVFYQSIFAQTPPVHLSHFVLSHISLTFYVLAVSVFLFFSLSVHSLFSFCLSLSSLFLSHSLRLHSNTLFLSLTLSVLSPSQWLALSRLRVQWFFQRHRCCIGLGAPETFACLQAPPLKAVCDRPVGKQPLVNGLTVNSRL